MLIHGSGSVVCPNRCVDYNNGIYCITKKNLVNSIQHSIDTLLYVINFEDNQGYAIVSAVDGQEHLLAITEQGHYTPQQKSVHEGVDLFIERAVKYVENQRIVSLRDTIIYVFPMSINPRVPVSWGTRQ
ncbi:MAG: Spi family protease inhibitor [Bacteroidales bacterium]|nr:Spi family protease inhibitor [Bacteroidales bacterium]